MGGSLGSFARLVVWEWRLAAAERSFRVTLVLLGGLAALAFAAGQSWSHERRAVVAGFVAKEGEDRALMKSAFGGDSDPDRLLGRPLDAAGKARSKSLRAIATRPTSVAYFGSGWSALFPPSRLAALSVGLADLWPGRYPTTAWSRRTNLEREEIVNPLHLATGQLDISSMVAVLLPLILIILNHDVISGDRERGILALALSQPVSLRAIVLARLLVRAFIPGLLVIAVAGAGLLIASRGWPAQGEILSFATWSLGVLLYSAAWAGLALMVNAFGGTSISNATGLVTVWVLVVILLPTMLGKIVTRSHPVPPRSELITLERMVREQAEKDCKALVAGYYREHPELTPPGKEDDPYGQTRWDAIARKVDREMQPALDARRDLVAAQVRFVGAWQFLSPALCFKATSDDLAGTSLTHQLEFADRAARHHASFMDYLMPMMMTRHSLSAEEFDRIPRYEALDLGGRAHPPVLGRGLLMLSLWAFAPFVVALAFLRRTIAAS